MTRPFRALLALAPVVLAAGLAGCCGDCIKDPPCRCWEHPCCLTDFQRKALEAKTHALPDGPRVYSYEGHVYFLFTEKGVKDFEKDPATYEAKGAVVLIRGGGAWRVDLDPGADFNFAAAAPAATPYTKPPS
jgi:hypothetical protein